MSPTPAPFGPGPTVADRRDIEHLVGRLPGAPTDDRSFDEPWEIRAFALAVAAHQANQYPWSDFQQALIESIRAWEQEHAIGDPLWSYYEHWVNALETVLTNSATLDARDLDARVRDVLAAPPNRNHHAAHWDPVAIDPATVPD